MAHTGERQSLDYFQAAQLLLEESRMILPGIQALFGFQLIVVFNEGFAAKLSEGEQQLHLLSIALIVVAIVLIMTPAAYHRQTSPTEASAHFIRLATRLMMWGMLPLTLGFCIDLYLVAQVIVHGPLAAIALALLLVFVALWYVLPRVSGLQRHVSKEPANE